MAKESKKEVWIDLFKAYRDPVKDARIVIIQQNQATMEVRCVPDADA